MTYKGGNKKKKKTVQTYSADTLALRFMLGIVLGALGVAVFLAVDMNMGNDDLLGGIRSTFYGAFGMGAMVMPFLLLWGAVLVVLSTQRRVPVKPILWACLAFFGLCTVLNLGSRVGSQDLFANLTTVGRYNRPTNNWAEVIGRSFEFCRDKHTAGGALGAMIGWPFYQLLGTFLGAFLSVLGTLAAAMMACTLSPSHIRYLIDKHRGLIPDTSEEDARRIQWQQQQEVQRAYEAEQAAAYEAQQQENMRRYQQAFEEARNNNAPVQPAQPPMTETARRRQYQPPAGWDPARNGNGDQRRNSMERWQRESDGEPAQTGRKGTHRSAIFNNDPRPEQQAAPKRKSRIFGTDKDENDGLSTVTAEEKQENRPFDDGHNTTAQPGFTRPSYAQQLAEKAARQAEMKERRPDSTRPEKAPEPEKIEWRKTRPEREPVQQPAVPQTPVAEQSFLNETEPPRPVMPVAAEEPEPPVEPAPARPEPRRRTPSRTVAEIPVVQQTIGKEAWQPELKLPPKDEEETPEEDAFWEPVPYNYPPITDLKRPTATAENTEQEDLTRSQRLEETLASFKVQARVVNVTHGPAISRFELELAAGTKVNKVLELEKDIAYGMEATSVRIEAPIPGKSLVGVEVPNKKVTTVTLREVLESERMQSAKSILTVALGKDIAGTPIVCDLAKMPHLLIAGATGSGKSVCINAIINSLLYRAGPDEVKMILVDPKVVELQCYNGIPHLLIPVVNDPRKAAAALAWAVAEMMDRYDKFADRKVRNLEGYNEKLGPHEKPMPRIVVIIDELADLMMVCKKDVEEYICRLTQLARAAGIHLIVATQRPSVDVITGLIKANIPSRIAFKTASYIDSRTILDRNGSEQLLGWGDMLYLPTGSFAPTRVQGCFLSDDEVNHVVQHVRENNPSTYDPDILDKLEELTHEKEAPSTGMDTIGGVQENVDADGDLFQQCVEMAIQDGQISTSTLQRRLKIGYSRAGRLTDQLEERGIISAKDGSKPRKCLITREQWEEMKAFTDEDM